MGHTDYLAHSLRKWTPVADPEEESWGISPGRVSTVFFFPQPSYDALEGKEEGWGKETVFGKAPEPGFLSEVG